MRHSIKILLILLLYAAPHVQGQYRTFVSVGLTRSFGGNLNTFLSTSPTQWLVEVEVDRKAFGAFYLVSGLSSYAVGYSSTSNFFGPADSDYTGRFLAVPILARWNIGNRNFFYVDAGIVISYLANAKLKETLYKFGNAETCSGDITPYLNRLYQIFKFQETLAFNRFTISVFFMLEFKGQNTINNLADHWGFNAQQSPFINSSGYSDFYAFGMKVGCRIR